MRSMCALWVATVVAVAANGHAAVLCTRKNGSVVSRDACRRKEIAVDVAALVPPKPGVAVRVRADGEVSVPYHVGGVAVPFRTTVFDTDGFFRPATSDTIVVAPRDGLYTITATVEWDRPGASNASMAGTVGALLVKTAMVPDRFLAEEITPFQRDFIAQSLSTVVRLAAGDGIELQVFNETGDTLTVGMDDPDIPNLAMVWDGP